jgi:hypothetical protein
MSSASKQKSNADYVHLRKKLAARGVPQLERQIP